MSGTNPQTLNEILAALNDTGTEVAAYFGGLPADVFSGGDEERWSPGHHLKHLILSNKPVAYALTLPRERLQAWDAGKPHRSYAEIRTLYQGMLGAGTRASGPFLPTLTGTQAEAVAEYNGSVGLLDHDCLYWEESDIDQYAMPHPVLGLLSVREMLFFTVLHNRHHFDGVKGRLERA